VAVERDARDVRDAELDGRVAGDVAPALQALAHLQVVDVVVRDARALQRLARRLLGQVEAETSSSVPLRAVPIAVRVAETMTASPMVQLPGTAALRPGGEAGAIVA
jgi:hypothetical protein